MKSTTTLKLLAVGADEHIGYVRVTPLPDAETALGLIDGWFEDYSENHPHAGLKWRSPREFIADQTATA